ncbi:MAG: hypothetical protein LBT64_02185 [Puniceicoccales bacterium]|jgi:hypothetical protein|nr:hypothetical protein [Puniceicoccales bacterium]
MSSVTASGSEDAQVNGKLIGDTHPSCSPVASQMKLLDSRCSGESSLASHSCELLKDSQDMAPDLDVPHDPGQPSMHKCPNYKFREDLPVRDITNEPIPSA